MRAIDLYLRPLSDFNTGTQPYIAKKAEKVEEIEVSSSGIEITQQSTIRLRGVDGVRESERPHSKRHWWGLIGENWFEHFGKPLRHHGDITDFVTALNICTDAPVGFSQSPGRIAGGYFDVDEHGVCEYNGNLSAGGVGIASAFSNEIPESISVNEDVSSVYQGVRDIREREITSDVQSDLMVALHMYDDALTGTRWTCLTNLFYVCENVLCSGYHTNPKDRIAEETHLEYAEAKAWADLVNRMKHPDKEDESGSPPKTLREMIEEAEATPAIAEARRAANTALTAELR